MGNGHFFIILSAKNLSALGKQVGDPITFELNEDPNPLDVEMPEVLEALLTRDEDLKIIFENLTPGKKRNVIHSIDKIKDIDKQVQKSVQMIRDNMKPRSNS